jgi:DNA polymerase-3 subunit alpha
VIISPQPMTNFTALQYPPKDNSSIITQYEAHALEDLGLLKMDFLGLKNLSVIKRTQKIIKQRK